MAPPLVTVIIPVRDEVNRLPGCLDALAAQDLPAEVIEVLVVDGRSTDATSEVARRTLAERGWWRAAVLHSATGDRSANLNRGLAEASAPIVVRVDARSRIPRHYLRSCLALLQSRPEVAVTGGRQRAVACGSRAVDIGVARALNNRWGMGLARYRGAGLSGEADTVYLGAYRAADLKEAGGWRTDLSVNEDFDLNRRLRTVGTVWLDADLTVDYLPRSSLTALVRQYWDFGSGKARYWRLSGDRPRPRQCLLMAVPAAGLVSLAGVLLVMGGKSVAPMVAAGAALAATVEVLGADGPAGGVAAHMAAVLALGCVAGAWLAGVATGAVRPMARRLEVPVPRKRAA